MASWSATKEDEHAAYGKHTSVKSLEGLKHGVGRTAIAHRTPFPGRMLYISESSYTGCTHRVHVQDFTGSSQSLL